ncbi:MAG: 30S ribosomal protein S5 [Candidatus Aenigmatarchaeota archaeon]
MVEEEKIEEELSKVEVVSPLEKWQPKTSLGKEVFEGKITDIEEIFKSGRRITEPEIVDKLLPNLKSELILIGGRTGKGGGIQRIPVKITATMHKSGRRFKMTAFVVVGNEDGIVGVGKGAAPEARDAIAKAIQKAKLNLIKIKRGCGSFECSCEELHSIPFKIEGKCGSVRAVLLPAPKGVGLVASDEAKKILRLAGIKDVWVNTFGNTSTRMNLIGAIFDALKKLYVYERGD